MAAKTRQVWRQPIAASSQAVAGQAMLDDPPVSSISTIIAWRARSPATCASAVNEGNAKEQAVASPIAIQAAT